MFIKRLIFPKNKESTKNPMFNNLSSQDFCYSENKVEKIAKFVILIGKNGSGKTSLLILIKKLIDKYVVSQKNCLPLEKYDDNYFAVNLSLIDRKIDFLFQKLESDFHLSLESNDIFDPEKELFCNKIFCDNNKNDVSMHCISFPTSSSIDKKENEEQCKEIYEENMECDRHFEYVIKLIKYHDDSLAKQIEGKYKNIFIRERYNQLFSKFGIKIFGDWLHKNFYFNISENDKKFNRNINQLPSGFRQLFNLWRTMLENNDTIFLIDEPENSLYPLEQEGISSFFIDEFKKNNKIQFFIATHSPFILKNFLNRSDAVIINVETGENILKSEEKKLLLNENNNVSYDEISYLYYDISTSNYYLSLFEKLKIRICQIENKIDITCNEIDNWLHNKTEIKKVICVKNNFESDSEKEDNYQTILVRFRHLLAHGGKNEKEYKYYFNNRGKFQNEKTTKHFYDQYEKENFDKLLRNQIETIRKILINWEKIKNNSIKLDKTL